MPPVAYALASDTAIGVVRAWTLARQKALKESLADDEATPLAMVLTDLLQNALQHGFPHAAREQGELEVIAVREQERLTVTVADSGVGLPAGFDLDSATSLGLQIVRTLVVGELSGRLRVAPRPGGGTEAIVDLPVGYE